MTIMATTAAEKIERLSPILRERAEGYIDALLDQERFVASIQAGLDDIKNGRVHDDDEVWQRMEARFGPLSAEIANQ